VSKGYERYKPSNKTCILLIINHLNTETMNNFKENNEKLNSLIEQGKAMEAFELFYAENVTMQENETEPRIGKELNREQCGGFVEAFPDLKLKVLRYYQHTRSTFRLHQ
jgi:hypothetical protein